jgi:hypothetical protein
LSDFCLLASTAYIQYIIIYYILRA